MPGGVPQLQCAAIGGARGNLLLESVPVPAAEPATFYCVCACVYMWSGEMTLCRLLAGRSVTTCSFRVSEPPLRSTFFFHTFPTRSKIPHSPTPSPNFRRRNANCQQNKALSQTLEYSVGAFDDLLTSGLVLRLYLCLTETYFQISADHDSFYFPP